jgi:hypothetical protein
MQQIDLIDYIAERSKSLDEASADLYENVEFIENGWRYIDLNFVNSIVLDDLLSDPWMVGELPLHPVARWVGWPVKALELIKELASVQTLGAFLIKEGYLSEPFVGYMAETVGWSEIFKKPVDTTKKAGYLAIKVEI